VVKNHGLTGQSELHLSPRVVVNHERVVAWEESHVSVVGNTTKRSELQVERCAGRGTSGNIVDAGVGLELLLRVWLGTEFSSEVTENDVV
jgi:hypothetical protein